MFLEFIVEWFPVAFVHGDFIDTPPLFSLTRQEFFRPLIGFHPTVLLNTRRTRKELKLGGAD